MFRFPEGRERSRNHQCKNCIKPKVEASFTYYTQVNIQINRYDAEGLRIEIEENKRLTKFIFYKENILVEMDKEENVIARLIREYIMAVYMK